jgi:glycerol-3-phosphate acyltransferase PlsY
MLVAYGLLSVILAYLLGAIPLSYLVARWKKGIDIREVGSRNMGAMNTFYSVGFGWGLVVLLFDLGKGALAVALADLLATVFDTSHAAVFVTQMLNGLAVVIGHAYPVFLRFRGGKGGAAAIGVLVYLMPWLAPVFLGIFAVLLLITKVPTVSYGLTFISAPFVAGFWYHVWEWALFSVVLVLFPGIRYIPRLTEMRSKAGSWRAVFLRRRVQERY